MSNPVSVWDRAAIPTATQGGNTVSYPFDRPCRWATVQSVEGLYFGVRSYAFNVSDDGATINKETSGCVSYPFDGYNQNARYQDVSGSRRFPFDVASGLAKWQDADYPVEGSDITPAGHARIAFTFDFSNLTVSTGASLLTYGTGKADGSASGFKPVFSAAPLTDFSADLSEIFVSPRSYYGPFVTLRESTEGVVDFSGRYDHVSTAQVVVNAGVGVSVGDISNFTLFFNGQRITNQESAYSLEYWQAQIEASAFISSNGYTTRVGTPFTHLQEQVGGYAAQLQNNAPYIRGWTDANGYHPEPSHIGLTVSIFPAVTGGYWTASRMGETTSPIWYTDSPAVISAKLNALPSVVRDGGVSVRIERLDQAFRHSNLYEYDAILSGASGIRRNMWPIPPITNETKIYITQIS